MVKYGKALAGVAFVVATTIYTMLSGDNRIEPDEWVYICISLATAVGVYVVPLDPQYRWGKTAVAVVLSVLQVLYTVILGGLDSNEWIMLVLAGLTALGVAGTPAVSDNGVSSGNSVARPTPGALDVH